MQTRRTQRAPARIAAPLSQTTAAQAPARLTQAPTSTTSAPTTTAPTTTAPPTTTASSSATAPITPRPARKQAYEKFFDVDEAGFVKAARKALQSKSIPQLAALRFDGTAGGVTAPSAAAKRRDDVMREVAARFAAALTARGFTVTREGDRGGDVLAGRFPEKYRAQPATGGVWGEAYEVLVIDVPRVGKGTYALLYKREMNEWIERGRPASYVEDKAEIMLACVDPDARNLWGSGYNFDDDVLRATDAAALDVQIDALVEKMVAHMDEFQALNARGRRRRAGVG